MNDDKLRILVLTKIYELNRKQEASHLWRQDKIFADVEPTQMNFCFQYLGTLNLITVSYANKKGIYNYSPEVITGKGIDIVESLMKGFAKKIGEKIAQNSTGVLDKVVVFLTEYSIKQDILDMLIKLFNEIIQKLMSIF